MTLAAALVVLAGLAAQTAPESAAIDAALERMATAAGQRAPLLRVGLARAERIEVTSDRPFRLIDPATGEPIWRDRFSGPLQVLPEGRLDGERGSVFRVQVGAYADESSARDELRRLEEMTGLAGIVRRDVDRGTWRVRIGAEGDRMALGPALDALRERGVQGAWIAEEPSGTNEGVSLRFVDAAYETFSAGHRRVAVVARGTISVGGRAYRGVVELRVGRHGDVQPVNWIELERYLLGVVPAELGPEVWPQIEALRAQAVAARTYAVRNMGQFADDGFDLCATPRCQVYKGASAEHPLSDRAVWSTRGEVLTFDGAPIVALYTATCGGHTEDAAAIFPEQRAPYLRGVPCRAEARAEGGIALSGQPAVSATDGTGRDVGRALALLLASGVVEPGELSDDPLAGADLRRWTSRLLQRAGLPEPREERREIDDVSGAAAALVRDLGWVVRTQILLDPRDAPALLRDPAAATLDPERRNALAYLVSLDAVRPRADGSFGIGSPVLPARIFPALAVAGERYRAFGLRDATVTSGADPGSLRMLRGKSAVDRPVASSVRLVATVAGRAAAVSELRFWPGDSVRYRLDDAGSIDYLELVPPVNGSADDRSSRLFSWEVRKSRRTLQAAINRRVGVGTLRDLEVVERGRSGRIIALRVVGSEGTTIVRGFDVRQLLDLRESLLVFEIERDDAGEIEAVVFAGKGWGHGVGLCQVGAFGMASRGATYREILSHYYRDTLLKPLGSAAE